ncbi:hypothetical protein [Embleya scabrispora]|uniref:hypothetical protein n=1 Tax=Embleya scabrispora TaxID=159449 RepID=UPI0019146562|nr:hypothetical protein [Embleya scabrispora]
MRSNRIVRPRLSAEFGGDPTRHASVKAGKNQAGTDPITRASGKVHTVQARYVRDNWLSDALQRQVFRALQNSPGAAATTTSSVPATSTTTPPCGRSATASSASFMAVSGPHPL